MSCIVFYKETHISPLLNIKNITDLQILLKYTDISKIRGYSIFNIKNKNSKKDRLIYSPNKKIKAIQKHLNELLSDIYSPPKSVHAYVSEQNIKTNATAHLKNNIIYTTDIKDFFPSIHYGRIRNFFKSKPFDFSNDVANEMTEIVSYHNMLPQGAPTSPIISNMICLKLDIELLKLAKKYHVTYTRYADDITFSCNRKQLMDTIIPMIEKTIVDNGFNVNINKTRLLHKHDSQKITGLKVNKFLNVDRRYVRQLRSQLYAWDKFGYIDAQNDFLSKYYIKHRAKLKPQFINVLFGRLTFLKFIRGEDDQIYIKLAKKFNALFIRDHVSIPKKNVNKLTYNDTYNLSEKFFVIDYLHDGEMEGVNNAFGTAFILHGYPYLITCNHVVGKVRGKGYDSNGVIKVKNYKNEIESVEVVKEHSHYDIAILELPSFLKNKYTLHNSSLYQADFNDIKQSEKIEFYGFPDYDNGDKFTETPTTISRIRNRSLRTYIEVPVTIKAGNSGGPALLNNKVIGLCTNGDHTMRNSTNKIISIEHIIEVLVSI